MSLRATLFAYANHGPRSARVFAQDAQGQRAMWLDSDDAPAQHLFHHVSTDEVYGSLGPADPGFSESTPYAPNSPYSASKAASDHLVRAYDHTYGLQVTTSNCSNNYGPYQFPEKLIPLMIVNGLNGMPLPVYGDGSNIRDWRYAINAEREEKELGFSPQYDFATGLQKTIT